MLTKDLCPIDFSRSALEIHNQIRGLSPWPVATAMWQGKRLKIFRSELGGKTDAPAGTIVSTDGAIAVACGDKTVLRILELQQEGKKRMSAADFLVGHAVKVGSALQ